MKRLFLLKMKDGVSVRKHMNEFNSIVAQLKALKVNLDEEVLCLLLLSSLPPSWDTLVTTVANTIGSKFKLNDAVSSLSSEETRRASSQMSSDLSQALAASERGRSQPRDDISANKSKFQGKGRSKSRGRIVTCWYCKK